MFHLNLVISRPTSSLALSLYLFIGSCVSFENERNRRNVESETWSFKKFRRAGKQKSRVRRAEN